MVVEQHAGIGERAATHVLDRETGEIAGVVAVADVEAIERRRRAQPDRAVGGLEHAGTADIGAVHILGEKVRRAGQHDIGRDCPRLDGGRVRVRGAAGARREQVRGGGPAAERVGVGRAQRIRDAGDPDPRPFDFAGALEHGAQPLGLACGKHRSGDAVSLGRPEQQRVAALRIDRDGLRLLPERRAALRVGIDRQRHRLDGAGRLPVGGLEDAADIDQARNRWG